MGEYNHRPDCSQMSRQYRKNLTCDGPRWMRTEGRKWKSKEGCWITWGHKVKHLMNKGDERWQSTTGRFAIQIDVCFNEPIQRSSVLWSEGQCVNVPWFCTAVMTMLNYQRKGLQWVGPCGLLHAVYDHYRNDHWVNWVLVLKNTGNPTLRGLHRRSKMKSMRDR